MAKLMVTRLGNGHSITQWFEEAPSAKFRASEHYDLLQKTHGCKPTIRQVGKTIFLILPKGMATILVEEL